MLSVTAMLVAGAALMGGRNWAALLQVCVLGLRCNVGCKPQQHLCMCLQGGASNLFAWARQTTTMASCELAPKEAPAGQDIATFAGGGQLLAHMPWDADEHSCFWMQGLPEVAAGNHVRLTGKLSQAGTLTCLLSCPEIMSCTSRH